jgi:hypothetical protein
MGFASLDRGSSGVEFKVDQFLKIKRYFTTGKVNIICPKLLMGKLIFGYEVRLPANDLFSESERVLINGFVITSYGKD